MGRFRFSLSTLLMLMALFALFCGVGKLYYWRMFYRVEAAGQSFETARRHGVISVWLPAVASNIDYWAAPGSMRLEARFDISEQDFLAWLEDKGFQAEQVNSPGAAIKVRFLHNPDHGGRPVSISKGYLYQSPEISFDSHRVRSQRIAAFDAVASKGYFTQLRD